MKLPAVLLLSTLFFAPSVEAFPFGRTGGSYEQCSRHRYNERYVPGYYNKHGQYVGGYVKTEKVNVGCNRSASSMVVPLIVNLLQR
jgi:hypothetical protein|tara:strand:+ start:123 stop:380 length:258 start_codon:yes stop_codon:yes gene_type:complete